MSKDLKTQLIEFAAKKAVAKAIDVSVYHGERQIRKAISNRKGSTTMASFETQFEEELRGAEQSARSSNNNKKDREPVKFWLNTIMVREDGGEPIRTTPGRPLRSFSANRDVNTSNEDFNRVNVVNNAFVKILQRDARGLELGQSKYYGPTGITVAEDGGVTFKAGIYFELHREKTDYAANEVHKEDAEAAEEASLRNLFGS